MAPSGLEVMAACGGGLCRKVVFALFKEEGIAFGSHFKYFTQKAPASSDAFSFHSSISDKNHAARCQKEAVGDAVEHFLVNHVVDFIPQINGNDQRNDAKAQEFKEFRIV